jgi:preprotein translocase subunit SecG
MNAEGISPLMMSSLLAFGVVMLFFILTIVLFFLSDRKGRGPQWQNKKTL